MGSSLLFDILKALGNNVLLVDRLKIVICKPSQRFRKSAAVIVVLDALNVIKTIQ